VLYIKFGNQNSFLRCEDRLLVFFVRSWPGEAVGVVVGCAGVFVSLRVEHESVTLVVVDQILERSVDANLLPIDTQSVPVFNILLLINVQYDIFYVIVLNCLSISFIVNIFFNTF